MSKHPDDKDQDRMYLAEVENNKNKVFFLIGENHLIFHALSLGCLWWRVIFNVSATVRFKHFCRLSKLELFLFASCASVQFEELNK